MLGMFVNHYGAYIADRTDQPWPRRIMLFTHGRAMPLFVVLSGIGFALLCRRPGATRRVLPRAALLLVAGLWLEGGLVAVILHFYALYLVAGLVVNRLPRRLLLPLAAAVTLIGAWIQLYKLDEFHSHYTITDDSWWSALPVLGHPRTLLIVLAFTGQYPFFPAFAFFVVGMWIAGTDLQRQRVQAQLIGAGVVLATLGYAIGWNTQDQRAHLAPRSTSTWRLLNVAGHSEMPAWIIAATGGSLIAIGICCWLCQRVALAPLVYTGQLALTFYVVHVFALRRGLRDWPWGLTPWEMLGTIVGLYAVFIVVATAWRQRFAHGPFEMALRAFDPRPNPRAN